MANTEFVLLYSGPPGRSAVQQAYDEGVIDTPTWEAFEAWLAAATVIGDGTITNPKLADTAEARIKGRAAGGGAGAPADLTAAEVRTILNVEEGADVTDAANVAAAGAAMATALAAVANGQGAALVGIEDAASRFTGTTVEAALAELSAAQAVAGTLARAATAAAGDSLAETTVAAATKMLRLAGYLTPGDGRGALYQRVVSAPGTATAIRSVDRFLPDGSTSAGNGGWWDVVEEIISDSTRRSLRDYGAVGNAPTSNTADRAALTAWQAAHANSTYAHLVIPPGTYDFTSPAQFIGPNVNPKTVIIEAYGATIDVGWYQSVTGAMHSVNGIQPKIATVAAGSSTITLLNLADVPLFALGGWVVIYGWSLMRFGSPSNPQFCEYRKITAIDAGTGVITLHLPLEHEYKSTWPQAAVPDAFNPDQGGPGTVAPCNPLWDRVVIYRGFDTNHGSNRYGASRIMIYEDCVFRNWTTAPSGGVMVVYRRCDNPGQLVEVDKMLETLVIEDCQNFRYLLTQSAVVERMLARNSHFSQFTGLAKRTIISNSEIDNFTLAIGYGQPESAVIENTRARLFTVAYNGVLLTDITWTNGEIRFDVTAWSSGEHTVLARMSRGSKWYLGRTNSNRNFGTPFTILDAYQTGSTFVLVTDGPASLPAVTDSTGNPATHLMGHPIPSLTVHGCAGADGIVMLNKAPAGAPLHSYYNSGAFNGATQAARTAVMWGTPVSITVNVMRAYTGASGTLNLTLTQFGMEYLRDGMYGAQGRRSVVSFNAKIAGKRVITPGLVTGAQSGDLIPPFSSTSFFLITGGTLSAGVNKITQIAVGATNLLAAPVDHTGNNNNTATAVRAAINAYTGTSGYTAAGTSNLVSLNAPLGEGPNGLTAVVTVGGDATVSAPNVFAGGADIFSLNTWFMGDMTPRLSANIAAEAVYLRPIIEVEIVTDQGPTKLQLL